MSATPQSTYRWDDGDQQHRQQQEQQHQHLEQQVLQHPLQHQPEQNQDVYASVPTPSSASTTVPLQDQVPIVPSQDPRRSSSSHVAEGDEPQLRLQHVSVPPLLQPEHMRPLMIDTNRATSYHVGTSASPPSGPSSAGPSSAFHGAGGLGPIRAGFPVHPDPRAAMHPYRRPQSAAGVVIARSRREPEGSQSVRYPRQVSSSTPMRAPYSTPVTVATTPREVGFPAAASAAVKMISTVQVRVLLCLVVSDEAPRSRVSWDRGLINPAYSARVPAMFTWVVLSTNPLNRVKQVAVTAKSPSPQGITDEGYVLRERKSGTLTRTFVVPSETTPDDITVEMRDGLLTLKIQCPPPRSHEDDAQEIVIR
ncbi:hypothetical protein JVU11DRAFT_8062 [Chiua virens]|nr:hypothetical protein JVU11DRAFT_8062 [Chiua virens]